MRVLATYGLLSVCELTRTEVDTLNAPAPPASAPDEGTVLVDTGVMLTVFIAKSDPLYQRLVPPTNGVPASSPNGTPASGDVSAPATPASGTPDTSVVAPFAGPIDLDTIQVPPGGPS